MYKARQKSVANGAEGSVKAGRSFREALRVVCGVLGGSEGSPEGRKKSTKPYRKALRTVRQAA